MVCKEPQLKEISRLPTSETAATFHLLPPAHQFAVSLTAANNQPSAFGNISNHLSWQLPMLLNLGNGQQQCLLNVRSHCGSHITTAIKAIYQQFIRIVILPQHFLLLIAQLPIVTNIAILNHYGS